MKQSLVDQIMYIDDIDFYAKFNGIKWTVAWKWKKEASVLRRWIEIYAIEERLRKSFEDEIREWINEGLLKESNGQETRLIPLMSVEQENKCKVRPVLDFRELNKYIHSHTGHSAVCQESIGRWRQMGSKLILLDLKYHLQL